MDESVSSIARGLPPLRWLLTFGEVMRTGSFAGAAARLHVTASAVSHQMRALEASLGKPLFTRARRAVTPTEDATAYHAAIAESFARIAAATRQITGPAGGRLTLHSSPSFATLWLMPRIGDFMQLHPDIDVALASGNEPVRLGEDGFVIDIQHARPVPEDCDGILLAEELAVPLASPDFVAAHGLARLSELGRAPLIYSLRSLARWDSWIARYAPDVVLNRRAMRFDRSFLALTAASDGLGLALESTMLAGDLIRRGRLVMPFGPIGMTVVAHRLVCRRSDRGDPLVETFIEWISGAMRADRDGALKPG